MAEAEGQSHSKRMIPPKQWSSFALLYLKLNTDQGPLQKMAGAKGVHLTLVVNCVFIAFLCLTTIVLNILTIQALRKTSSLPKTLRTLLLSLVVSDLDLGLLVQLLYVAILVMEIDQNTNGTAYYSAYEAYLIQKKVLVLASHLGVFALPFEFNCIFTIHCKPAAVTTTTTSLFQIKYSLQSLCPQLAKAIRGGYKRKKGNCINISVWF